MKKFINKTLAILLFVGVAISCDNNEDAIFNEPSSERIQNAISEYKDLLTSSDNGWIMEYYPDESQSYGGFNYGVKFNNDLNAEVIMELFDFSSRETNSFNIIANGGPVLTFDTHNAITHFFATPNQSNPNALGGDYEFFLISKTESSITLKGARSSNTMRMFKLTESPEAYLTKVLDVKEYLAPAAYTIAIDGTDLDLPNTGSKLVFPQGDEESIPMAYNYTDKGIKLYQPVTIGGVEVLEFILDKDANELVSLDGSVVISIILIPDAPINMEQDWQVLPTNPVAASPAIIDMFAQVDAANTARWGETLRTFFLIGNTDPTGSAVSPGVMFISDPGPYAAQYLLAFKGVIGAPDQLNITKVEGGFNWTFYNQIEPLVDLIANNAPYTVDTTDPAATQIKLTSAADPTIWFFILR